MVRLAALCWIGTVLAATTVGAGGRGCSPAGDAVRVTSSDAIGGVATIPVADRIAEADDKRPAPRRPRAEPLPDRGEQPSARRPRRPSPPRESEGDGPIGCPDRHQKLELIV